MPWGAKLLTLLALTLLLALLLNHRLGGILEKLTEAAAQQQTEALLSDAISAELTEAPVLYSDIVTLRYTEDGTVSSLSTDTARLIRIRTGLVRTILSTLTDRGEMEARVPIASLLGINLLPSAPAVTVPLCTTRTLNAYFVSEFRESGINQTLHRILLCISLEFLALIPGRPHTVTVTREYPFAETLIVGKVPDAYTHIHRLTDDITESEIDDIYDFGAKVN
jgi:sporulation protein YunB